MLGRLLCAAAATSRASIPLACTAMQQVWLNPFAEDESKSIGDSLCNGDLVLMLPKIASDDDCKSLLAAGVAGAEYQRMQSGAPSTGRHRMPVSSSFPQDVLFSCEELLLRVLDRIDEELPSVYETLFRPSSEWASRQPLTASQPLMAALRGRAAVLPAAGG